VLGGTLEFCIITNNVAFHGGGASHSILLNCIVIGNEAFIGGGVYSGHIENCLIIKNKAITEGGVASAGLIINCTISKNKASLFFGGIGGGGLIINTICWGNTLEDGVTVSNHESKLFSFSCTTPLPDTKVDEGNIALDPLFVDPENGHFKLRPDSPCIDAGTVSIYARSSVDLNGRPRLQGKAIDMGAFEFTPIE